MSKFIPQAKHHKKLQKLFKDADFLDEYTKQFEAYRQDPIFCSAARLVRALKPRINALHKLIVNTGALGHVEEAFKGQPLMTLAASPDMVRVYVNLVVDDLSESALSYCSWAMYPETLKTFYEGYREQSKDAKASMAWYPFSRAWKRLKKFEELPTARALSRYTNLGKMGCGEARIRDIAVAMDEMRKPMELIFVDSLEKCIDMYATGPGSCMSQASHGGPNGWKPRLLDHGLHPTSFFFYHPFIQGVYAKSKGSVIARTFVYEKEDGKKYFGRVYGANPKFTAIFEQTLTEMGIEFIGPHTETKGKFIRKATFSVPGGLYNKEYFCPLPYCDNMSGHTYIHWDETEKVFNVLCNAGKSNVNLVSGLGFVPHTLLTNRICFHCGREFNHQTAGHVIAHDGTSFHSQECANAAHYVQAKRSDRGRDWVIARDAVRDSIVGDYYTTEQAAAEHGLHPIMEADCEDEDGDNVTRKGHLVRKGDTLYRYVGEDFKDHVYAARFVKGRDKHKNTEEDIWMDMDTKRLVTVLKPQKVVEIEDSEQFAIL